MKSLTLRLFFLLLISLSFTFCSNEPELEVYTNTEILNTKSSYSQIENEISDLVNEYRVKNNLSTLAVLNIVSSVADSHTNYMIQNGAVSHDNFQERVANLKNNANAKSIGENVAYGYSSAQSALNGWLNSPEHKKIIDTSTFTHFGISTKTDKEGRNYFTQIFITK